MFFGTLVTMSVLIYPAEGGQSSEPITVCDLLSDLTRHDGRELLVRGEFYVGVHGIALINDNCKLTNKDERVSICVQSSSGPGAPSVDFTTDLLPLEAFAQAERTLREAGTGFRGTAVIRGKLFVARSGRGFCHASSFRVLLVAKNLVSYSSESSGDVEKGDRRD